MFKKSTELIRENNKKWERAKGDSVFNNTDVLSMIVQNSKTNAVRKKIRTYLNTTQKSALFSTSILLFFFLFWEIFILFSSTTFQKHWKKLLVGHSLCSFQNIRACWLWVKNRENFFLFLCCTSVNTYPLQISLHVPLSLKFTTLVSRYKEMDRSEWIKQNRCVDLQCTVIVTLRFIKIWFS